MLSLAPCLVLGSSVTFRGLPMTMTFSSIHLTPKTLMWLQWDLEFGVTCQTLEVAHAPETLVFLKNMLHFDLQISRVDSLTEHLGANEPRSWASALESSLIITRDGGGDSNFYWCYTLLWCSSWWWWWWWWWWCFTIILAYISAHCQIY